MPEPHLCVYSDRSEYVNSSGDVEIFEEGNIDDTTRSRYEKIKQAFASGFLEECINNCYNGTYTGRFIELSKEHTDLIDKLVDTITSEFGRALVAISIMQLSIKTIEPSQSIRLHKGGHSKRDFSWREGISMRVLDKNFVTPVLRKYELIRLNADGFMMTRSFAENYPYSIVYKAHIRGARSEWLTLVEDIETERINTEIALHYLLTRLINQAESFRVLADETLDKVQRVADHLTFQDILTIIWKHVCESEYAARAMEIAMHALMQALEELGVLAPEELKPLSQMRSANKKHGNVGDIELLNDGNITESWDAKFEKPYLRDEIEELIEKLKGHSELRVAGFVLSDDPVRIEEIEPRIHTVKEQYDVDVKILKFSDWVNEQFQRLTISSTYSEDQVAQKWLLTLTESLAQKRREKAPIDESCYKWLVHLQEILNTHT